MNTKILFMLFLMFAISFSQEIDNKISNWHENTEYKEDDVVLFNGVRYESLFDENKNVSPIDMRLEDEEYYNVWQRYVDISEPLFISTIVPHLGSIPVLRDAHSDIRDIFREDSLVRKVAYYCGIDFHSVRSVASWKESSLLLGDHEWIHDEFLDNRKYNNYTNIKSVKKSIGQIIHNIGDAGVLFGHNVAVEDKRERANERRAFQILNDDKDRKDLIKTYFTGTIYDVIKKHKDIVDSARIWAIGDSVSGRKASIPSNSDCSNITKCHTTYKEQFNYLVKGDKEKGEPICGVMRSAIAAGRFILADFMLARQPLQGTKITADNSLVKINQDKIISAYAKDPDAVRFLHKDTLKDLSEEAMFMFGINENYELWHDPKAHSGMNYLWDVKGNNKFDSFSGKVFTFKVIEFLDNPNNIDPSEESFTGRTVIRYATKRTKTEIIEGEETNITIDTIVNDTITVKNSNFELSVKIIDDEKTSATAKRQFTFLMRAPFINHSMKKENCGNPFLVKVHHKNTYQNMLQSHYQGNGMEVISGYGNSACYNPVSFDAFSNSFDLDGNATDQITKAIYDFGNKIEVLGKNQHYTIGKEERLIMNSLLYLESKESNEISAYTKEYFVSSSWNNNESPRNISKGNVNINPDTNYEFKVSVYDNEVSESETKEIKLPVLTPPIIEEARLYTKHLVNTDFPENNYSGSAIELDTGDMAIVFYAEAIGEISEDGEIFSYSWAIQEENKYAIHTADASLFDHILLTDEKTISFTHQELLDLKLKKGKIYDVFLKIVNGKDEEITKIENGHGFTITKVGSFKLE